MLQRHRALAGRAIQVTSSNLLPHLIRHVSFLKLNLIRIIIFFLLEKQQFYRSCDPDAL